MHFLRIFAGVVVLSSSMGGVGAIRTVPSSQCAAVCGDPSTTKGADIVCSDSDYANTAAGKSFQACITCQMNSTAVDLVTGDTDLKWMLYNLRFAMSTCLWGFPNSTYVQNTPCITSRACGPFEPNIQFNSLAPNVSTHDYCNNFPQPDFVGKCSACLQQLGSDFYISNFFTALLAGCQQQSALTISVDGSLFQPIPINITSPSVPNNYTPSSETGLSLGAKIGIAIGALLFLFVIAGIIIIQCGKRRRRHKLAERQRRNEEYIGFGARVQMAPAEPTKWSPGGDSAGLDESPYPDDKHSFSPYSSKYSSPISARDQLNPQQNWEWPQAMGSVRDNMGLSGGGGGFELERLRNAKAREAAMEAERERVRATEELMREAEERGFTTSSPAPILGMPGVPGRTWG